MDTSNNYSGLEKYSTQDCNYYYAVLGDGVDGGRGIAIYGCEGERAEYPSTIDGIQVTDICKEENSIVPHKCSTAIFPEGVERIWQGAFAGSQNLKDVVLPMSIKFMAFKSFADCPNLKTITIPRNKLMGIARAFQSSSSIEKISTCDTKEHFTLEQVYSLLYACMEAIKDVESGKPSKEIQDLYNSIKDFGWYDDVKEMM